MSKTLNSKIQVRRDTSVNWATNNPILLPGEIGFDTTIKKIKIGDGTSQWNQLPFIALTTDIIDRSIAISQNVPSTSSIGDIWFVCRSIS